MHNKKNMIVSANNLVELIVIEAICICIDTYLVLYYVVNFFIVVAGCIVSMLLGKAGQQI